MAAAGDGGLLVCVTGASGFIGSWLVRCLLDRGYTVHATVKNLQDEGETKHLQAMGGADTRLRLFQMDLVDPPSVRPAIEGAHGVFHLASPMILQAEDPEAILFSMITRSDRSSRNPIARVGNTCTGFRACMQKELLEPAVKGTLNVLRAAKDCGVGRVVLMSSQAAMVPNPNWPAGKVIDDDCWADVELLKKLQIWYSVSKTLAEKAAWDFAEQEGLQIAVLNPGMVLGPMLTPSVNASLRLLLQILGGERLDLDNIYMGCVDVRDVVHSLIMLYENPSAQGRHLCIESVERLVDLANKIADLYPEYPVQRIREDKQGWVVRAKEPSKKLIKLGVRFTPLDETIKDTVDCFRSKGLI